MSRGRKPNGFREVSSNDLFIKNRPIFFQIILKELGKLNSVLSNENSIELFENLKSEKKKINKDKSLTEIKSEELPFKIPKNWNWCKLGEIFQIERGSSPRPKGDPRYFSKERTNNHWIKISDLSSYSKEGVLLDTNEFLTDEGTSMGRFVSSNDIIVAVSGSVGKTSLLGINGYIYDGFISIKNIHNNLLNNYLYNLFKYFEKELIEKATGAIWQNINTDIAKNLLIPLPPIVEQKMIIDFLDDLELNSIIENKTYFNKSIEKNIIELLNCLNICNQLSVSNNEKSEIVKQLRESFLREAMQGKLVKSNNTKETGQQLLAKIKAEKAQLIAEKKLKKEKELSPIAEEEIPFEIPYNWTWCRLGEIIFYTENLDIHKNLSNDTIINYVDITSVDNKKFRIGEIKKSKVFELSTRARRVLKKDYILYSTVRPYLKNIAIIDEDLPNFIGSTGFNVFKPIASDIKYLFYFLLSPELNKKYEEMMVGFNSPSITNEQFENTLFALPPLHEQEQIVAKLEELMAFCDGLEQSIKESQGYNEKLLQQVLREALQGEKV